MTHPHQLHGHPLPLSREWTGRIARIASMPLLIVGGVVAAIDDKNLLAGLAIVGIMTLAGGIWLSLTARPHRRLLDAMAAGQRFVHWTYATADWQRCVDLGRESPAAGVRTGLIAAAAGALVLSCLLVGLSLVGKKITPDQLAASIAGAVAISIGGGVLIAGYQNVVDSVRSRLLLRGGGHVLIGPHGLYYSGEFWQISGMDTRFLRMRRDEGPPPTLVFVFKVDTRNGFYDQDIRVPIPPGREPEAQDAAARIDAAWGPLVGDTSQGDKQRIAPAPTRPEPGRPPSQA